MDEKQIRQLKVDLLNLFDKALRDALFRAALPPEANYVNWSDKKISEIDYIKPMTLPANLDLVAEEFKRCGIPHLRRYCHGKWEDRTAADREFLKKLAISED